jgi:gliding motility-associated lipoprotein GldH
LKSSFPFLITCLIFLVSCNLNTGVFEKNVAVPQQEWHSSFKPEISFKISDTAALYNIFVVLRHDDAYNYNNIWLNLNRRGPDTSYSHQLELTLANIKDNNSWLGSGMDDIWETRTQVNQAPVQFRRAGDYQFVLEQIMREDPLKHVLNVGIRIERVVEGNRQ